jgi:hypothetical protein
MSTNVTVFVNKDNNIQSDRARAEAAAINAENALIAPARSISVFSNATDEAPFFTNIATALSYASTLTPTKANPVYIRYLIPTPFVNDVYDLFDSGIVFESPFDPFLKWFDFGEDLDLSKLLYTVNLSRTKREISL